VSTVLNGNETLQDSLARAEYLVNSPEWFMAMIWAISTA
jgi:hypothetical protein